MKKDSIEQTKKHFLEDVENHSMDIIRNDGVNRHISFTNNGSQIYRFDLITWPGKLCITGDCGTYVFSRIADMFEFFRMDDNDFNKIPGEDLNINPCYWGEKLLSICQQGGYKEFSPELFEEAVKEDFSEWKFNDDPDEELSADEVKAKLWKDIESDVLSSAYDGDVRAYDAANQFKSEYGHEFIDFWDHRLDQPTFHYIWCLYAIVWGINKFDSEAS